jgi:hypothetical protein
MSNQGIGGLVQIGLILASLTVGHMGQLRPRIVSVSLPGQLGTSWARGKMRGRIRNRTVGTTR